MLRRLPFSPLYPGLLAAALALLLACTAWPARAAVALVYGVGPLHESARAQGSEAAQTSHATATATAIAAAAAAVHPAGVVASRPFEALADAGCGVGCVLPLQAWRAGAAVMPMGAAAEAPALSLAALGLHAAPEAEPTAGLLGAPAGQPAPGPTARPAGAAAVGGHASLGMVLLGLVLTVVGAWRATGRPITRARGGR